MARIWTNLDRFTEITNDIADRITKDDVDKHVELSEELGSKVSFTDAVKNAVESPEEFIADTEIMEAEVSGPHISDEIIEAFTGYKGGQDIENGASVSARESGTTIDPNLDPNTRGAG